MCFPQNVPSPAENADAPPAAPRPSIFISYASENRDAARLLRDALGECGLDVWYDENELGGGDAWDQKIRRQIRECTYFMPVISAQTEARREGYFRREWRLAVDRSHDMADDAMFLIPAVIDGTTETGARVPEKFLTVQWLRVPGGKATPGLRAVGARLAAGEHLSVPPVSPPPLSQFKRPAAPPPVHAADPHAGALPPMPPFPHKPADRRDNLKYVAEVLWWVLASARLLWARAPKWVRALLIIWFVFAVVLRSCHSSDDDHPSKPEAAKVSVKTEVDKAAEAASLEEAAAKLEKLASDPAAGNLKTGFMKAGAELARAVSKEVADGADWKGQVEVLPFAADPTDPDGRRVADQLFGRVYSLLSQARPAQFKLQAAAQPGADDGALAATARAAGDDFIVAARGLHPASGPEFEVRLVDARGGAAFWTGHYPVEAGSAISLGDQVADGLLGALRDRAAKAPKP